MQKQILIFSPGFVLAILGTLFGLYWLINVDVAEQLELSAQLQPLPLKPSNTT